MSNKHSIGDIKDLRPLEQVLEFLHRNSIPLTADALDAHLEQLKSELNLSDLPSEVLKYLAERSWEYREADVKANYLKNNRIDLFLHPRFAPINIHSHSYFEIKYLLSGSASILVAGLTVSLEAGDLFFIAPGVEHMVDIYDNESLLLNIIITPDAARSAFPRIYFSENPLSLFFTSALQEEAEHPFLICHTGADEAIQRLLLAAYQKRVSSGPVPFYILCESITENLMLEVLASHTQDFEQTEHLSVFPEKLFPILGYISDHCTSVNLSTLSTVFNYSPAHLSRLIKQYTGKSFSELLRSARLSQASVMLRSSDLPIQDIMLRAGYTGKAHFYRVFQEAYGMTPAQFRAHEKEFGSHAVFTSP